MVENLAEKRRVLIVLGAFVALGVVTPFLDLFMQSLVTEILVFGILAMSLDLLLGFTGLAS